MSQDELILRPMVEADRARIMEISSQIWDGEDWVPEALTDWLNEKTGEAVAAVLDKQIVGFAHRTWLCPKHAWFEGLRTDPACRGQGTAKAMTQYMIQSAHRAGAETIHLSTYIDNKASIHILESSGFKRVASFVLLERPAGGESTARSSNAIEPIGEEEAAEFVARSPFLELAHRRFPRGWRFFPFDIAPRAAVSRLETRIGIRSDDALVALACVRERVDGAGPVTLNFCDGTPEAMRYLIEEIHQLYAGRKIETKLPKTVHGEAAVLPILRKHGYQAWNNFDADVFAYELALS